MEEEHERERSNREIPRGIMAFILLLFIRNSLYYLYLL
jgi:hypothetical protein